MKANFIIGKKQIIVASLVVVLGAAIYLNWAFAQNGDYNLSDEVMETPENIEELDVNGKNVANQDEADKANVTDKKTDENSSNKEKNMGDSMLVDNNSALEDSISLAADEYFAKAKLTKMKSRDMAIDTINTVLNDEKSTAKDKEKVSNTAIDLSNIIEVENKLENLIKAKGIDECMVYINNDNASVVVKSEGLSSELATQIKNIVLSESSIKGENVSITEIK